MADARRVNLLADALLVAASEYAHEAGLLPGGVLGAFGVALGRVAGALARDEREALTGLLDSVMRHVRRTARLEAARRSWVRQ